jgi:hypothetical protein
MNPADVISEVVRVKATGRNLVSALHNHRELFHHIPQEKQIKKPEEWVPIAEKLAKEHNGIMPCSSWVQKNFAGLDLAMRKNPKLFDHIKQENKYRTHEEWVQIGERLAKEHDGILPCPAWLQKNGYSGFAFVLRKNPKLFAHIKQGRVRTPVSEWVTLADKLAKGNHGVLQSTYWLKKNNYDGLNQAMWKYPELFSHIKKATAA